APAVHNVKGVLAHFHKLHRWAKAAVDLLLAVGIKGGRDEHFGLLVHAHGVAPAVIRVAIGLYDGQWVGAFYGYHVVAKVATAIAVHGFVKIVLVAAVGTRYLGHKAVAGLFICLAVNVITGHIACPLFVVVPGKHIAHIATGLHIQQYVV